jgi:hypothetical protein
MTPVMSYSQNPVGLGKASHVKKLFNMRVIFTRAFSWNSGPLQNPAGADQRADGQPLTFFFISATVKP